VIEQLPPFDGFRKDRPQRIEFAIHCGGPERLRCALGPVAAPAAREALAFELFDPMSRDFVQDHATEGSIQHFDDLSVALNTALVEFRIVAEIGLRERPKGDVGLFADAVTASENPRALCRFDLLRFLLVRGLGRVAIPLPVYAES
jgi:hypothetical protein